MFALGLAALAAHAQDTVQSSLASSVPLDARGTFGVAAFLDRDLFPRTDLHDGAGIGFSTTFLPGVLRIPALQCDGLSTTPVAACTTSIDVAAGSGGLTYNTRYVGVFYAVSWNVAQPHDLASYAVLPFTAIAAPFAFGLLTPAFVHTGALDDELFGNLSAGLEYTAGARLFAPVADGRIGASFGYYASGDRQGFYSTLTDTHVRAVATALFAEGLPYLLGGVQRSPLFWQSVAPLGARALLTSAFVRKVALDAGDDVLPEGSAAAASAPALWTGHLEQFNLGPVDVQAAVAWKPAVLLHRLTATVHNAHFNADDGTESDEDRVGVGVTAGVVSLPEARWLAVEGGLHPYLEFGVRGVGDSASGGAYAEVLVAVNHPDVLAAFPYSRNALLLRFQVAM